MNITDLIEAPTVVRPRASSPGSCPLRPGELPAPRVVEVRADDLEPGDVVALGAHFVAVEAVARRVDGAYRIVLADGSRFDASASELWEVRRG